MAKSKKMTNRQPGMNSYNIRGGGDAITVRYNGGLEPLTTDAFGTTSGLRHYIPGYYNNFGVAPAGVAVAQHYAEGVFYDCYVKYTPAVGMTTPGRVWIAHIDNPESIRVFELASLSAQIAFIKSVGNVVTGPVYRDLTFRIPGSRRRKAYDTNATTAALDENILDRCNQGTVIFAIEGGPVSTSGVGTIWCHDQLRLTGLQPVST